METRNNRAPFPRIARSFGDLASLQKSRTPS